MTNTLEKILSNDENEKVIKFLNLDKKARHFLTSVFEKEAYTHEGLEEFLKIDVPNNSKFILDGYGIIIRPETGEIIAFQFGRSDIAFKILNPNRHRKNCEHIREGLIENQKPQSAEQVSLGYFSNVYNDRDTIIDIREFGSQWALSIYFHDQTKDLVKEFYHLNGRRNSIRQILKILVAIMVVTILVVIAFSIMFSPLPIFR